MEIGTPPAGGERRKPRHRSVPLLPEVRHFKATSLEIRSEAKTDAIIITGSPVVYGTEYEVCDAFGVFSERMAPGVATAVLERGVDCRFLVNHAGLPLARSTSGTMVLTDTPTELTFEARLDARQQLANDLAVAIERGDVSQMSCGFCVDDDDWDEAMENRTINSFAELLDVSAVTYPASPTTSISVAQRMALAVPVESRARLRRFYLDGRAGKALAPERFEALRSMLDANTDLDPGDDTQTPAGTGRLGSPDGNGKTWSDPGTGTGTLGDGTEGQGTTGGTGMSNAQDGTGSRAAPATAAERREQSMSFGDRQSAVCQAIRGQYGTDCDIWIRDMGEDWVVWQDYQADTLLRCSHAIDADGNVTLVGDPQPVAQHTTYKAVEQASRTTRTRVRRALRGI